MVNLVSDFDESFRMVASYIEVTFTYCIDKYKGNQQYTFFNNPIKFYLSSDTQLTFLDIPPDGAKAFFERVVSGGQGGGGGALLVVSHSVHMISRKASITSLHTPLHQRRDPFARPTFSSSVNIDDFWSIKVSLKAVVFAFSI